MRFDRMTFSPQQREALARAIGALRERADALAEVGQDDHDPSLKTWARYRRQLDLGAVIQIQRMIAPERFQ